MTAPLSITVYNETLKRTVTVVDRLPRKGENGWWVPIDCDIEEALARVVGEISEATTESLWDGRSTNGYGWGPVETQRGYESDDDTRCVAIILGTPDVLTVDDIRTLIALAPHGAPILVGVETSEGHYIVDVESASLEDGSLVLVGRDV